MLLTITTTATPATDLGYLLHKNPSRVHRVDLSFGQATVFYPEATPSRCTGVVLETFLGLKILDGFSRLHAARYAVDRNRTCM